MTSRRVLLVGGAAVLAGLAAACTAAVRSAPTGATPTPSTASPPAGPTSVPPPTSTSASEKGPTSGARPGPARSTAPGPTASRTFPAATRRPTSPSPVPTGPADFVAHGPRTATGVALTFHGQGDPAMAREILAIVAAHRARITVLAVGTWLADHPELAREILAGGHELGNHTWSHGDINAMAPADARAEIVRCRDRLITLTGSGGRWFRQSQSPTPTDTVRTLAGAAGYRTCLGYDVDGLDWTDPGPDAVRAAVAAATGGSIVSLHLGHQDTIDALPSVLGDLAARGLTAVTASALLPA